jgi:Protein of unknown function (DUF1064)
MTKRAPWPMVVPAGTTTVGTARVREDRASVGYAQKKLAEKFGTKPHSEFDELADGNAIARSIAQSARTASEIGAPTPMGKTIARLTKPTKASKYRNTKCEHDGVKFDSQRERSRWFHLIQLQAAGEIRDLRLQVPFVIAEAAVVAGKKRRARTYVADFVYLTAAGDQVVEDVKGMQTPMYQFKRHLMKTVHGIDILEVK